MASARRGTQAESRGGATTRLVNYTSLAGEFFVLGELALRRLDASMTLGHTKEIDILVLNRATGRTFKVEVKLPSMACVEVASSDLATLG
jgi:hypothetical protein